MKRWKNLESSRQLAVKRKESKEEKIGRDQTGHN
jgi:hypothetical protein